MKTSRWVLLCCLAGGAFAVHAQAPTITVQLAAPVAIQMPPCGGERTFTFTASGGAIDVGDVPDFDVSFSSTALTINATPNTGTTQHRNALRISAFGTGAASGRIEAHQYINLTQNVAPRNKPCTTAFDSLEGSAPGLTAADLSSLADMVSTVEAAALPVAAAAPPLPPLPTFDSTRLRVLGPDGTFFLVTARAITFPAQGGTAAFNYTGRNLGVSVGKAALGPWNFDVNEPALGSVLVTVPPNPRPGSSNQGWVIFRASSPGYTAIMRVLILQKAV